MNWLNVIFDTTPYNVNLTQELVINDLAEASSILFKWSNHNYAKVNSDNSHPLMSLNKAIANIDNNCIDSEDTHELLGITFDLKLKLETNVDKLCKKASQKLNALAQIFNYMTFDKIKIIMKAFITSQFSQCSCVDISQQKIRLENKCIT